MKKWLLFSILWLNALLSFATPLPASEVFQVEAKRIDPNTFVINWEVKPGYFLYSDRIKLTEVNNNTPVGEIRFPATEKKIDHLGREYMVYRNKVSIPVSILSEQAGETLVNLHYQGCADDGFCYPPETKQIKLGIDKNLALNQVDFEAPPEAMASAVTNAVAPVIDPLVQPHRIMLLLTFYGLGLLLAFTPCVLPMVPVLSGIIVGHSQNMSTRKAFFLSLNYVLGMAITYAIAGAIIATLGANLQIAMQTPWAIGLFSLVFILLALSMFGLYELRLPVSWQAKLAGASRGQSGGHYLGAAIMGCLSTLILSPCVTAPLIGALGYIANTGEVLIGALALFCLGLGMGTPLLLIGTSAGKWLPKAGHWMNAVKAFFGVLLLAVAIYLLSRILPAFFIMMLWAILLIFTGIFCGAFDSSESYYQKFQRACGIILFVYGLFILAGAAIGNENPLQPLQFNRQPIEVSQSGHDKTVHTINQVDNAIAAAKGKDILLDFYADWCASCKVMEATVLQEPVVRNKLNKMVVLRVDLTDNSLDQKALLKRFQVVAPPTFIFLDKQGSEIQGSRLVGEVSSADFLKAAH